MPAARASVCWLLVPLCAQDASAAIFDHVQHELAATKTEYFSQLSHKEKVLIIDKAAAQLKGSSAYQSLAQAVSAATDDVVGTTAINTCTDDGQTEVDLLVEQCSNAAAEAASIERTAPGDLGDARATSGARVSH